MRSGSLLPLLMVLAFRALADDERPTAEISKEGVLSITLPAAILGSSEVERQLTGGLTTVFLIKVDAAGEREKARGGTRIEVRLELWEEKFLVTVFDVMGGERDLEFASYLALEEWWGGTLLPVTAPVDLGERAKVEIMLRMLPFSVREQKATRRWLSRTLSASGARTGEAPAQSAEILRIIVETSVRRRPLLEHRWTVWATRREEP